MKGAGADNYPCERVQCTRLDDHQGFENKGGKPMNPFHGTVMHAEMDVSLATSLEHDHVRTLV